MKAINKIIILGMVTTLFSSCDLTLLPEKCSDTGELLSK
jgi:hypothetical protein